MDGDRSDWVRAELENAIGARYEILELHGQGGMGMVFCARDRVLERLVAIKVLTPGARMTGDARARFQREARHNAAVSHPSIVPVIELGETREFPYIVMEFVKGESLARKLRHEGRLSADVTRRMLLDLSDALDYAHRNGIIHRDIKPENVLIRADSGRAMLADFGIAKALNDGKHLTQSGVAIGTPEYMSPEQAVGDRNLDHRSDLYSLGALGYTMLAGRPPHQGNGVGNVMTKHLLEDPVALRQLAPDAPQDLVAAISRCLEKDPQRRWPDARAFHRAIAREASEDEPVAEELRAITGFGAFMVVLVLIATAVAVDGLMSKDNLKAVIALLAALLIGVGFVNHARGIADNGSALPYVLRVSMWPPKWWGLWWPRSLRRPGDVWECLPTSARLTRIVSTFMLATVLLWLVGRSWLSLSARGRVDWGMRWLAGLALLVVALSLLRWIRIGFSFRDSWRLLFGPTVGATFWTQSHVNAVLLTRPDLAPACATPDTVRAMLHAIEDAAGRLVGRSREAGSTAAEASRLLVNDIERLDADIADLAQDAEALASLERQLSKMAQTQRDVRQRLEEAAKMMRARADLLDVRRLDREDANGTLRAIWTVIERLREQSGRGSPQENELIERLHALATAARDRQRPRGAQGA
jgi:hypothetical protein